MKELERWNYSNDKDTHHFIWRTTHFLLLFESPASDRNQALRNGVNWLWSTVIMITQHDVSLY